MMLFRGLSKRKSPAARVVDTVSTREMNGSGRHLSYQIANLQMIGMRERQEDSFAIINAFDVTEIIKNGLMAIVADGMGGLTDGKLISETAVRELVELFHGLDRSRDIPSQLYSGVLSLNERLYKRFHGSGGTTMVMAVIYHENLYWISVGDSAIYLKRNGGLFQVNKEHTYLNQLYLSEIYEETIDKANAQNDADAARLSEFLGIDEIDEMDYNRQPLRLRNGDVLLLCSDGVSGYLSEAEIAGALELDPSEGCARLNAMIVSNANPRQDNYTGLIIACKN